MTPLFSEKRAGPAGKAAGFILPAVWMAVIWCLSAQSGEESSRLSGGLSSFVMPAVRLFMRGAPETAVREMASFAVRKGAHMAEYAVLLALLWQAFARICGGIRGLAFSELSAFLYACTDEWHQTHVPGRGGVFTDVCVDMTGVLLASALVLFFMARRIRTVRDG